ncbi:uncharacterized protein BDR25DRAFT_310368 [Lindgomyces ingoldianus]|uniref:Uncharacterized protein n=1 Tax=Lindgomyces ingoldianus TaxID=673940 RepID=A0ACB6RA17_9PLEO|nr:uncharacterized protein BDR25DRAFT_310368 [Lindgomyces ingoldianus]KAF2475937.1 hypothetical protein BDR25DRAFT_310368 [Lindgomyces ingoldianus]
MASGNPSAKLDKLPIELLHQIYKIPENENFLALRSTCRILYNASPRELVQRFEDRFTDAVFRITPLDLELMLWLSGDPLFRHYFQQVSLIGQYLPQYTFDILESQIPGQGVTFIPESIKQIFAKSPYLDWEGLLEFKHSPDVVHILTQIFTNLKGAKGLHTINIDGGFEEALAALKESRLENVAVFVIWPEALRKDGDSKLWSYVPLSTGSLRGIIVRFEGLHGHKGYDPSHPSMRALIKATRDVPEITIYGCKRDSWVHFCPGCYNLFTKSFSTISFPNLRSLKLVHLYISGYSFRTFIAQHSKTLTNFEMMDVRLISDSWKALFHQLQDFGTLKLLRLAGLYQNVHEGRKTIGGPGRPPPRNQVDVRGDSIAPFLVESVQNFGIFTYCQMYLKFAEVELLVIPGISEEVDREIMLAQLLNGTF